MIKTFGDLRLGDIMFQINNSILYRLKVTMLRAEGPQVKFSTENSSSTEVALHDASSCSTSGSVYTPDQNVAIEALKYQSTLKFNRLMNESWSEAEKAMKVMSERTRDSAAFSHKDYDKRAMTMLINKIKGMMLFTDHDVTIFKPE